MGGAQAHLLTLIRALRGSLDLSLGAGSEGPLTEEARALGVAVHVLPALTSAVRPWRDALATGQLARLLRAARPDLVSTHSFKAGLTGRYAARRVGIPAVFTAHGWGFTPGVPWPRRELALRLERLAARWSERIITVCETDRALALRRRVAASKRIVNVRNGVPDVGVRADPGRMGPMRLIMVARLEAPKDHDLLLRATASTGADWRITFVGDGPTRGRVESRARRLGLGERVEFLGWRRDVAEQLGRAHAFVLASRWEGLPLTVLEALRAGLPVVASDVGGVREAVSDGETGYVVPPGDEASLARRLAEVAGDPTMREKMGAAGRRLYETRFTSERMVAETLGVYDAVLAGRIIRADPVGASDLLDTQ
jgi:glycosyltransferase involved in cell wall biosynthesis